MFASNEEARRRRDRAKDVVTRIEDLVRSIRDPAPPPPANSILEECVLEAARRELRARRERERLFGSIVLADPSWDILLDLFVAREEGRSVDMSSICHSVPVTEGAVLRCLGHLVEAKMVTRQAQGADLGLKLTLTENGRTKLREYFNRTTADGGAAAA
jgi:hypothetical protein